MNNARRTIASPVRLQGTGLFTGDPSAIEIRPTDGQPGIFFLADNGLIPAHISALSGRPVHPAFEHMPPRCTSIADEHTNIATVEHLLSALAGLGITDAFLQLTGPEVPILDGSARPFVDAILDAGTLDLPQPLQPITVTRAVRVEDANASITVEPAAAASYHYTLDYGDNSPIKPGTASWSGAPETYIKQVAPARTFCLDTEASAMHNAGLFTHLSTRDMLVVGEDGPIENRYRFENECAGHKLLDLIGDLSLVGAPLCARVTAERSGHALAHRAARAVIDQIAAQ